MTQIQAASVSKQIVGKRKRAKREPVAEKLDDDSHRGSESELPGETVEKDSQTTIVATKTEDGGQKPRRVAKSDSKKKPALKRQNSSTFVESSAPWPPHFSQLAQTYRALNVVYTFCCTRQHFATTFDNIKAAVENHIGRELKIRDIAQMKALQPAAINFVYVEEELLQVDDNGTSGHRSFGQSIRNKDHFVIPDQKEPARSGKSEEVLLFEFVDGDLKRQVPHPQTGEAIKASTKLRNEKLRMPVFSQKQLTKLIEKRNTKFASAVNEFLNECLETAIDPVLKLEDMLVSYIPEPSESRSGTPAPNESSRLPPTIPKERKSIPEIIEEIKSLEWYTGQIVPDGHRVFDAQPPVYGDLKFELSQNLVNALFHARNISQIYAHQAEAMNNLYDGNHVIVSTSTSSGKSLIYQLPVIRELERDVNTRAMYIFPTKALAQDQRGSLKEFLQFMPGLEDIMVETFDGDTPMQQRGQIRNEARIIFTNPDMLHITILPQEDAWREFLRNLRYVVVDELHVYNGLFGSHVAFIMRRLRRVCAALGNRHIKFVSCSATVANPEHHMKLIFGVDDVKLTDFDGSPSGRKEFLCWNTPFKDPGDPTSGRGSAMTESGKLFCQLMLRGVRVISFCKTRASCEAMMTAVKDELTALERLDALPRVMSYRGGYTPQDRRNIEREMFDGKLLGIVATTALELGVDIGSLDAVITVGFPYSIANLRQQSGRAGRRNKDSLSVLIGDCFPTDQHYMDNTDEIFTKPNCELQVDLENMLVLEGHLQCAAHEMPIKPIEDQVYFGKELPKIAAERMRVDDNGFYHCNERFLPRPSTSVSIRDVDDTHFAIIDITNGRNIVLEQLEASRANFTIYEGGIFKHQGNTFLVKEFSLDSMYAKVEKVRVEWSTQQRDYTDIDPIETEQIRPIPGSLSRAFYGAIKIKQVVYGYFKLDKKRRIIDAVQVDNPPIILHSKGMWLDVPQQALEILNSHNLNIAASIHAAEHAVLSLMPQYVVSMPEDVRTECKNAQKEFAKKETSRKRPARLTFYDAKGGATGSGISSKAFEFIDELLKQACRRVEACHCLEGCLECCCAENCHQANIVMSKAGAEVVLKTLLNEDIDVDALPWGEDERTPAGIETVSLAKEVPMRAKVFKEI